MRDVSYDEAMDNNKSKLKLLSQISENLLNQEISIIDTLAGKMKAMTDCCFCHVEY